MDRSKLFNAFRNYVNAHGIEPRAGFVNNNLTIQRGPFQISIEGRSRGLGVVTVRKDHKLIAIEETAQPGAEIFEEKEVTECLLAVAEFELERERNEALPARTVDTRAEADQVGTFGPNWRTPFRPL